MTLSIASNGAGYGKPLGYGLAGLIPIASVAEAGQLSSAAASWSYTPSAGAAGRDVRLSGLMAVLSRLSAGPEATATGRAGATGGEFPGSTSDAGSARSDAANLLQALNETGGAPPMPATLSSEDSSPAPDRQPVQVLLQRPTTDDVAALQVGPPAQAAPADPSTSAAEAQLQALFKTLQAYGL